MYTVAYQQVTSTINPAIGWCLKSEHRFHPWSNWLTLKWYQLVHESDCLFSMQNFMCFFVFRKQQATSDGKVFNEVEQYTVQQ